MGDEKKGRIERKERSPDNAVTSSTIVVHKSINNNKER